MRIVAWLLILGPLAGLTAPAQRALKVPRPAGKSAYSGFRPQRGETVLELSVQNRGEVFIDLDTQLAPKTTGHIIELARRGFYNGQRFFKVLRSPRPYLVQTGDPLSKTVAMTDLQLGRGGSGSPVPFEDTHIAYSAGAVVMATKNGNRDSGDSQFYILLADYGRLLRGTGTVFGRVVTGMDVVNRIQLGDRITAARILAG